MSPGETLCREIDTRPEGGEQRDEQRSHPGREPYQPPGQIGNGDSTFRISGIGTGSRILPFCDAYRKLSTPAWSARRSCSLSRVRRGRAAIAATVTMRASEVDDIRPLRRSAKCRRAARSCPS